MGAYQQTPPIIPSHLLPKNLITCLVCAFLSLALLHYYSYFPLDSTVPALLFQYITPSSQSPPPQAASLQAQEKCDHCSNSEAEKTRVPSPSMRKGCDYSEGRWVRDAGHRQRYNGTACNVKDSEDCIRNGRPDTGYLSWWWQPEQCALPAFDAEAFLSAVRGKHVAFVGDSMARNQAESLVCLLSTAFPYELVYRDPDPGVRKFWRWAFPSHGATVSVYWAPFLVKAGGRSENYTLTYNTVFLDTLASRWAADADTMDVAVLAAGHWFWEPAIYHNGSEVFGTHLLAELNHTEVGFFTAYREVIRKAVDRLRAVRRAGERTVVLATFSPAHFEKEWDDPATCARKEPYREGEKEVGPLEAELRKIAVEEAAAAAAEAGAEGVRVEALDVTKLAAMRPDGHPGVYFRRDPFASGVPERIVNDCLHFCLPGPVDTFNDILLQLLTKRS